MTRGNKAYIVALAAVFATMGLLVSPSFTGNAFAHAHMTLTPDIENVNPISVTIGHTDEPAYGVKPGVYDGRHNLEFFLEDAETALPLSGANLTVDRYYFKDIGSFDRASSPDSADQVETNITLEEAFGEPGRYELDQIHQPGIYGYRVYGTIDYFGIAEVPIDTTMFCGVESEDATKFNSEGWEGDYGCTSDIEDLYWPNESNLTRSTSSDAGDAELQQAALTAAMPTLQMLAIGATAAVGGFFGFRAFRNNK